MKNLYDFEFVFTDSKRAGDAQKTYDEIFRMERNGYQTKYRVVDGAIYKADDLKLELQRIESSVSDKNRLGRIETILKSLYQRIYDICELIDMDKEDSVTVHKLPKSKGDAKISSIGGFTEDYIMPLLDYYKGVIKDSKNNVSFDDCVRIVSLIEMVTNDITAVSKDKKRPAFAIDYDIKVVGEEKTEQAVVNEPVKAEPIAANSFVGEHSEPPEEEPESPVSVPADRNEIKQETEAETTLYGKNWAETITKHTDRLIQFAQKIEEGQKTYTEVKNNVKINVPDNPECSSVVDDIRKNIESIVSKSLEPVQAAVSDNYLLALNAVNELKGVLDEIMGDLKERKELCGIAG